MDKVHINQLKVSTIIGVNPWEQQVPQTLVIDIALGMAAGTFTQIAQTDSLQNTLDYAAIATQIQDFAQQTQVQLLETFAEKLCQALFTHNAIQTIDITLTKAGAIESAASAGVFIARAR